MMVFFRTRLEKISIWQNSSKTWESDFKALFRGGQHLTESSKMDSRTVSQSHVRFYLGGHIFFEEDYFNVLLQFVLRVSFHFGYHCQNYCFLCVFNITKMFTICFKKLFWFQAKFSKKAFFGYKTNTFCCCLNWKYWWLTT